MNLDVVDAFARSKARIGTLIELPAGDDSNILSVARKREGEIAQHLTVRRMVRIKVSTDKDKPAALTARQGQVMAVKVCRLQILLSRLARQRSSAIGKKRITHRRAPLA